MEKVESIVSKALKEARVEKLLVGVSGGADSMALLRAALAAGVEVHVVHCNFHLRGAESNRDRAFVSDCCKKLGIWLTTVIDFNVEEYRIAHKLSVEEACRELRYNEFRRIKAEIGSDRIAVAHNADDQAETVLLNLMRGAGVAGMRGMLSDTGEIIRPLLGVSRAEILEYLESIGQDYVTDSTNLSSDYRRNFLRNEVIPLLETRWPQAKKSICKTAAIMASEEQVLNNVENILSHLDLKNKLSYRRLELVDDPAWLVRRFCRQFDANETQCKEILTVILKPGFQSGKVWHTPKGRISAEREYLEFIDNKRIISYEHACERLTFADISLDEIKESRLDVLWTTLPQDKILFRGVIKGDRIEPLGATGSTLVSKIMKDAKLTLADKEQVVVAVHRDTGEVIWVEGLKRSRLYLVDNNSEEFYCYIIMHHDAS